MPYSILLMLLDWDLLICSKLASALFADRYEGSADGTDVLLDLFDILLDSFVVYWRVGLYQKIGDVG